MLPGTPLWSSVRSLQFPRINAALKGHRFKAIQTTMTGTLNEVSIEAFQGAYRTWKNRWKKSVDAQGENSEDSQTYLAVSWIHVVLPWHLDYFINSLCTYWLNNWIETIMTTTWHLKSVALIACTFQISCLIPINCLTMESPFWITARNWLLIIIFFMLLVLFSIFCISLMSFVYIYAFTSLIEFLQRQKFLGIR